MALVALVESRGLCFGLFPIPRLEASFSIFEFSIFFFDTKLPHNRLRTSEQRSLDCLQDSLFQNTPEQIQIDQRQTLQWFTQSSKSILHGSNEQECEGNKTTSLTPVIRKCHHSIRDAYGKGKHAIPETRGTEEGSAKRNITRKHDPVDRKEKKQHGGAGGKGKWNILDDGSMDL